MKLDLAIFKHIYIKSGYTDMRMSIDGLAALVQQQYMIDPEGNSIFLFCGRRRDRFKALFWDGDGFVLMYKRLESRGAYQWPNSPEEVRQISMQQFRWLMEGIKIVQKTALAPTALMRIM
ncbi:MAG: IS66 family insertion sequence element accessory protein TnpB [Bacteroidales bacterium]|jgi:transposase|nr:IS66 family insertion sequence element accessory protein TnpB [Bacteroidales bacterium]